MSGGALWWCQDIFALQILALGNTFSHIIDTVSIFWTNAI